MKKRVSMTIFALCYAIAILMAQQTTDSTRLEQVETPYIETQAIIVTPDSVLKSIDSVVNRTPKIHVSFKPNPQKSLWYALAFPGLGQIYNRKYWKLPIVYGGAAGLTYAITWNNKYYQDYARAYRDIMDSDPNTKSYEKILPYGMDATSTYAQSVLKNKQNSYRRYRDLSIVGAVAFYALTVIDAYVDAQLSDFDISPDLSMQIAPTLLESNNSFKPTIGVQLNLNF